MICEVHLHGRLKRKFGAMFKLDIQTAGEAIRALHCQIKTFSDELKKGAYEVIRGHRKNGHFLVLDDVNSLHLGNELHIVPVAEGRRSGKGGGVIKAILGVALIGAALFFSGGTLSAAIPGLGGALTYGNLAVMGLGLMLAGVGMMLSPQDEKKDEKKKESFTMNGPGNSYDQGNPVPLVYGRTLVGSTMITGGLDIEDIGVYNNVQAIGGGLFG